MGRGLISLGLLAVVHVTSATWVSGSVSTASWVNAVNRKRYEPACCLRSPPLAFYSMVTDPYPILLQMPTQRVPQRRSSRVELVFISKSQGCGRSKLNLFVFRRVLHLPSKFNKRYQVGRISVLNYKYCSGSQCSHNTLWQPPQYVTIVFWILIPHRTRSERSVDFCATSLESRVVLMCFSFQVVIRPQRSSMVGIRKVWRNVRALPARG